MRAPIVDALFGRSSRDSADSRSIAALSFAANVNAVHIYILLLLPCLAPNHRGVFAIPLNVELLGVLPTCNRGRQVVHPRTEYHDTRQGIEKRDVPR
jgi:hypothetical protein